MKLLVSFLLLIVLSLLASAIEIEYDAAKYCASNSSKVIENDFMYGCACSEHWGGVHCDICKNDNACIEAYGSNDYYCSNNLDIPDGGRVYTCKVNDDEIIPYVGDTAKLSCENNNDEISCVGTIFFTQHGNLDNNFDYFEPSISCLFTQCSKKKMFNSYDVTYVCEKAQCACIGDKCKMYSQTIENTDLQATAVVCNKNTKKCSIESGNAFIPRIFLDCDSGICINNSSGVSTIPDDGTYIDDIKKQLLKVVENVSGFEIFEIILFVLTTIVCMVLTSTTCYGCIKKQISSRLTKASTHNDFIPNKVIDISIEKLSVVTKGKFFGLFGKKEIICNISTKIPGGKLTAIMGLSGAGKSTLLSVLSNRTEGLNVPLVESPYDRTVKVNPITFGKDFGYDHVGKLVCFIPQKDNHLPEGLTVRQYLNKTMWMTTNASTYEEINEWTEQLGLTDFLDVRIGEESGGTLSGGQRRLVSICASLITGKKVLILDEPVSGLDSQNQAIVMRALHNLANDKRKTIIISIHSPSEEVLLQYVDNLVMIASGVISFNESPRKSKQFDLQSPPLISKELAILHRCAALDSFSVPDMKPKEKKIHPGLSAVLMSFLKKFSDENTSDAKYTKGEKNILKYLTKRASYTSTLGVPCEKEDGILHIRSTESELIINMENVHTDSGILTHNRYNTEGFENNQYEHNDNIELEYSTTRNPPTKNTRTETKEKKENAVESFIDSIDDELFNKMFMEDENLTVFGTYRTKPEISKNDIQLLKSSDENLVSWFRQFSCVAWYEIFQFETVTNTLLHFAFYLLISSVVLLLIHDVKNDMAGCQTKTGYFVMLFAWFFLGSMSSIKSTQLVPKYISFESNNNRTVYGIYNTVRLLIDIVFCRLLPLVLVYMAYPIINLREGVDHFLIFMITIALFSLLTSLLIFVIGLVSSNIPQTIWMCILVLLFNLLFSGLIINERYIPDGAKFLLSLSYWHAAGNVLLINEFDGALVKVSASGFEYKNLNGKFWLNMIGMAVDEGMIGGTLKLLLFLYALVCFYLLIPKLRK